MSTNPPTTPCAGAIGCVVPDEVAEEAEGEANGCRLLSTCRSIMMLA